MQFLLNDLKKLSLKERLEIIEKTINSFSMQDEVVNIDREVVGANHSELIQETSNWRNY